MSVIEHLVLEFEREVLCKKRRLTEQERLFFTGGACALYLLQHEVGSTQGAGAFAELQKMMYHEAHANSHLDSNIGKLHQFHCDDCINGVKHVEQA